MKDPLGHSLVDTVHVARQLERGQESDDQNRIERVEDADLHLDWKVLCTFRDIAGPLVDVPTGDIRQTVCVEV